MIEVIYKEEKAENENGRMFALPKNIRQIGSIHENYKIYMEDYVYTFLGRIGTLALKKERNGEMAILLGRINWMDGVTYVFIQGAIWLEGTEAAFDHIFISEDAWNKIKREQEQYFPDQEIVGWFLTQQGILVRSTEILTRAHIKYFSGEKVLFLMEPYEREDAFFCFENNFLNRQSGYYLYFEKNERMQSYIIAKQERLEMEIPEKTEDKAVKNFREIIRKKQEEKDSGFVFSYAATACLVLLIGLTGMRAYQRYRSIQEYRNVQEVSANNVKEAETERKITVTPTKKPKASVSPVPSKNLTPTSAATPAVTPKEKEIENADNNTKNNAGNNTGNNAGNNTENNAGNNIGNNTENNAVQQTVETYLKGKKTSYVVRPGDSLFQISLEHYGTIGKVSEICERNGFTEDEVIYPGQIILLP